MIFKLYETVAILKGALNEGVANKIADKIAKLMNSFLPDAHPEIPTSTVEVLGKKKLAYEIRENTEGWYFVFNFWAQDKNIAELERYLRIIDDVIKFITVRRGDSDDDKIMKLSDDESIPTKTEQKHPDAKPIVDLFDLIYGIK